VDAAQALFVDRSTEFTLDRIAASSGVSVQTVLRLFGSKEELILAAIGTFRQSTEPRYVGPSGSIGAVVERLFDDYEEIGDRVIRMLAEEHRIAGFADIAAIGRAKHRDWVTAAFGEYLAPFRGRRRTVVSTALLAATDVYVWQLLRRDLELDRTTSQAIVERLVRGALDNKE
jgi:AcrR family transcriptional regulator